MLEDYKEYLDKNLDVLKFIEDNNIKNDIMKANLDAQELSNLDGKQYLHSYRYSKVYDVLNEYKVGREKVFKIVELLENPYNKELNDLIDDSLFDKDNIVEIF